ncbi:MAG: hypothetical protein ACYCTI_05980 [Acidimicrobiales bacterium]
MRHDLVGAYSVGTTEFRDQVSEEKLLRLLSAHQVVAVGPYRREPSAVVIQPDHYAALASAMERVQQMRQVLPLLLVAARSGIAIPSQTLAELDIELPDDSWQALNRFQARIPLNITDDAEGNPIARGTLEGSYVGELDQELVVVDD